MALRFSLQNERFNDYDNFADYKENFASFICPQYICGSILNSLSELNIKYVNSAIYDIIRNRINDYSITKQKYRCSSFGMSETFEAPILKLDDDLEYLYINQFKLINANYDKFSEGAPANVYAESLSKDYEGIFRSIESEVCIQFENLSRDEVAEFKYIIRKIKEHLNDNIGVTRVRIKL